MNLQDFINTAHNSVYRTGLNTIDYSNSLLLYAPGSEKVYENVQTTSEYRDEVTKAEIDFLKQFARPLMSQFPFGINYIDLGPGTEYEKQKVLFNALKSLDADVYEYCSVDVNRDMAAAARDFAKEQFPKALCSNFVDTFENMKKLDWEPRNFEVKNFFYLGLTFMNFHFEDIIKIIDECLEYSGAFFISFEPREYMPKNIIQYYGEPMAPLYDKKMSLLGFNPEDYTIRITDEVKAYAKISSINNCTHPEIRIGDELSLMMSLRYELEDIKQKLEAMYHCQFDDNKKFVGAMLRKK